MLNHTTAKKFPNRRFHDKQFHCGRRCRRSDSMTCTLLAVSFVVVASKEERGAANSEHRFGMHRYATRLRTMPPQIILDAIQRRHLEDFVKKVRQ